MRRQITIIWQSLPILSKVLILILFTIMIPFIFTLTFSILLTLVFVISGLFLDFQTSEPRLQYRRHESTYLHSSKLNGSFAAYFFMSIVGVVFGGIHCVGRFFKFPTGDEAILWRLSLLLVLPFYYLYSFTPTCVTWDLKSVNDIFPLFVC